MSVHSTLLRNVLLRSRLPRNREAPVSRASIVRADSYSSKIASSSGVINGIRVTLRDCLRGASITIIDTGRGCSRDKIEKTDANRIDGGSFSIFESARRLYLSREAGSRGWDMIDRYGKKRVYFRCIFYFP